MKTLFVDASANLPITLKRSQLSGLPSPVGIVSTVQHARQLKSVQRQIPKSVVCGAVLGCNVENALRHSVACFLFVGTGKFHPLMLALKSNKPVYVFNPYDQRLSKIEEKEVDEIARRKKVGYIKFLHASSLGILVSTKPGQQKLKEAFSLKNCLKRKSYVLIADDIEIESLRNFPFIDCFVNTACPRLLEDSSVAMVNMEDLGQWLG